MEKMTFWGYRRPDGRVGIRNKILILPASVCASDTTRIIASQVESAVTFRQYLYSLENIDFMLFFAIYLLIYSIFTPILSQYFKFSYFFFFLFF